MTTKKRFDPLKKVGGAGVGSAMAGLDGAVFRDAPPPLEVVEQHGQRGPVATDDGKLLIVLPDDEPQPPK
jgi:hypothetical protein